MYLKTYKRTTITLSAIITITLFNAIFNNALAANNKIVSLFRPNCDQQCEEAEVYNLINLYITRYLSYDALGVAIIDLQSYKKALDAYNIAPQQLKNEEWRQVLIAQSQQIAEHMNNKPNREITSKQYSPQPLYEVLHINMQYKIMEVRKEQTFHPAALVLITYSDPYNAPYYRAKKIRQLLIKIKVQFDHISKEYKIKGYIPITNLTTAPIQFF